MSGRGSVEVRIDAAAECIWRDGEKVVVPPKAFLVLRRLMARPGQLVTKDELLEAVWSGTYVTEKVLSNAVVQLRQALGDDPKRPRFIETAHRRGFRWIGPLDAARAATAPEDVGLPRAQGGFENDESSAFVGRADSLAELGRHYARAAAGTRQVVFVSGEPGIGKTALVDRFVDGLAATAPHLVARGQCIEAIGAGDPYRPWHEIVERLWNDGGDEIRAVFRSHAPSWLLSMPELSSREELEQLRRSVVATTIESVQREIERALESASAARTLVLVLEDLHWSAPAAVALLGALAVRRAPARLLIIGTYRPVDAIARQHPIARLARELGAKRQSAEIALSGLPSDQVEALLDRHFARHALPEVFAARLHDQTAGNPLFVLNALADFTRRGSLLEQDGVWRCGTDLDAIFAAVPDSSRQLIALRLDQLSPTTHALLEAASLVGTTFSAQTVAAASERSGADVETELEPLARAGFFLNRRGEVEWPDGSRGGEYEFRHALYRQVLSAGITPSRRQSLHRRIALALERGYGERVAEVAGPLSLHHEHAGDALRAVDYIDLLVQQAYARSAVHVAAPLLAHAVALLKRAPAGTDRQQRLTKAAVEHGLALHFLHGAASPESLRALDEARALGQAIPATPQHIAALTGSVSLKFVTGNLREAHAIAQEILALAGVDESPNTLIAGEATAGVTSLYLGEVDAAVRHLQRAVAIHDPVSSAPSAIYDPAVLARMFLGFALLLAGRAEQGRASVAAALELARSLEMPMYLGSALTLAAALATVRRDLVEARQLATAGLEYGVEKGLVLWDDLHAAVLGWVDVLETRDATRLESLRQAVERFAATGNAATSRLFILLADACLAIERIDDAARALDAAFDARREEHLHDANLLRLRASVLLARSSSSSKDALEQAEQTLERAIEIAATQGNRLFGLRATVDLGRLWLSTGKREPARRRLAEALGAFAEGFDETDLREARALLDQLAAGSTPKRPRRR